MGKHEEFTAEGGIDHVWSSRENTSFRRSGGDGLEGAGGKGNGDGEGGAPVWLAFQGQFSAVEFGECFNDAESEAEAAGVEFVFAGDVAGNVETGEEGLEDF